MLSMFALLLVWILNVSSVDDATRPSPWCGHGGCIEVYKNPCSEFERQVNFFRQVMSTVDQIPPEIKLFYKTTDGKKMMEEIIEEIKEENKLYDFPMEEAREAILGIILKEIMEKINNCHDFPTDEILKEIMEEINSCHNFPTDEMLEEINDLHDLPTDEILEEIMKKINNLHSFPTGD